MRPVPGAQPLTASPPLASAVAAASIRSAPPYALASAAFARYFQDVRARIGLPLEEVARRLSVDPRVIHALESGAVSALPAWPEVERVVTLYMRALTLDPAPPLRAIAAAFEQEAATARARLTAQGAAPLALPPPSGVSAPAPSGASANVEDAAHEDEAAHSEGVGAGAAKSRLGRLAGLASIQLPSLPLRRFARTGSVLAVMVAIAGGAVLFVQSSLAKSGRLPAPAAEFMRSASDSLALFFAPKRDGLRWIEVADPRTRRGDKLQIVRR